MSVISYVHRRLTGPAGGMRGGGVRAPAGRGPRKKRLSVEMVRRPRNQRGNCIPMYIGVWLGGQQQVRSRPRPNTPDKTEKAGEAKQEGLEGTSLLAGQRTGSGTTIKLISTTRWRNGREEGGQRRGGHQVDAHN